MAATGIPASGTPISVVPRGVVLPNIFSITNPDDSKKVLMVSRVKRRKCVRSSRPVSEYLNTPASKERRTSPWATLGSETTNRPSLSKSW